MTEQKHAIKIRQNREGDDGDADAHAVDPRDADDGSVDRIGQPTDNERAAAAAWNDRRAKND
jgi:hypothetical protein